ncbi:hypothetical protein C8R47DRAFT_1294285 [Mycena vitilis]|nr:hypothetical protein C8R47DRAFT_1294285 [Mycena vitilis]
MKHSVLARAALHVDCGGRARRINGATCAGGEWRRCRCASAALHVSWVSWATARLECGGSHCAWRGACAARAARVVRVVDVGPGLSYGAMRAARAGARGERAVCAEAESAAARIAGMEDNVASADSGEYKWICARGRSGSRLGRVICTACRAVRVECGVRIASAVGARRVLRAQRGVRMPRVGGAARAAKADGTLQCVCAHVSVRDTTTEQREAEPGGGCAQGGCARRARCIVVEVHGPYRDTRVRGSVVLDAHDEAGLTEVDMLGSIWGERMGSGTRRQTAPFRRGTVPCLLHVGGKVLL